MRTPCCSDSFLPGELRVWGELEAPSLPAWPSLGQDPEATGSPRLPQGPAPALGEPVGPYLLSATRFSNTSPPTISLSGFRQICTM